MLRVLHCLQNVYRALTLRYFAERPRIPLVSDDVIVLGVADVLEGQVALVLARAPRKSSRVWRDASVTFLLRRVVPRNYSTFYEAIVGLLTEQHLCHELPHVNEARHRREQNRSYEEKCVQECPPPLPPGDPQKASVGVS